MAQSLHTEFQTKNLLSKLGKQWKYMDKSSCRAKWFSNMVTSCISSPVKFAMWTCPVTVFKILPCSVKFWKKNWPAWRHFERFLTCPVTFLSSTGELIQDVWLISVDQYAKTSRKSGVLVFFLKDFFWNRAKWNVFKITTLFLEDLVKFTS